LIRQRSQAKGREEGTSKWQNKAEKGTETNGRYEISFKGGGGDHFQPKVMRERTKGKGKFNIDGVEIRRESRKRSTLFRGNYRDKMLEKMEEKKD